MLVPSSPALMMHGHTNLNHEIISDFHIFLHIIHIRYKYYPEYFAVKYFQTLFPPEREIL